MKKRIFTKLLCLCLVLFLLPTVAFAADGGQSTAPTVYGSDETTAYRKYADPKSVQVKLDMTPGQGSWKIYGSADLAIGASDISTHFDAADNVLTLSHTTEIPDANYWVTFTEEGKAASESLKITVSEVDPSADPMATFAPDRGEDLRLEKNDASGAFIGMSCDGQSLTDSDFSVLPGGPGRNDSVFVSNRFMKKFAVGDMVTFTFNYDAPAKNPITEVTITDAHLTKLPLTVGGNGMWRMGSTTGLAFTVTQELAEGEKILGVMLDDNGLLLQVPQEYTIADSTVTLTPAYLTTLTEGQHTLKILIGRGEGGPEVMRNRVIELPPYTSYATATFTVLGTGSDDDEDPEKYAPVPTPVPAMSNPDTGVAQTSNHFWWMLLGLSLLGATTVLITIRKKTDA